MTAETSRSMTSPSTVTRARKVSRRSAAVTQLSMYAGTPKWRFSFAETSATMVASMPTPAAKAKRRAFDTGLPVSTPKSTRSARPHVERDSKGPRDQVAGPTGQDTHRWPPTSRQSADDLHGGAVAAQREDDVVARRQGRGEVRPLPLPFGQNGIAHQSRGGDRLQGRLVELRAAPRRRIDHQQRAREPAGAGGACLGGWGRRHTLPPAARRLRHSRPRHS